MKIIKLDMPKSLMFRRNREACPKVDKLCRSIHRTDTLFDTQHRMLHVIQIPLDAIHRILDVIHTPLDAIHRILDAIHISLDTNQIILGNRNIKLDKNCRLLNKFLYIHEPKLTVCELVVKV